MFNLQVKYLMQNTVERFGKLNFLVNNGGGQFIASFKDINTKGWNAVVDTNLNGTYLCLREGEHSQEIYCDIAVVNDIVKESIVTKREYSSGLVVRVADFQFRVLFSKPLDGSKVSPAFHYSEFGIIIIWNFWNMSVRHNILARSGFIDLRQSSAIYQTNYKGCFKLQLEQQKKNS